jgi:hypothetical protein
VFIKKYKQIKKEKVMSIWKRSKVIHSTTEKPVAKSEALSMERGDRLIIEGREIITLGQKPEVLHVDGHQVVSIDGTATSTNKPATVFIR